MVWAGFCHVLHHDSFRHPLYIAPVRLVLDAPFTQLRSVEGREEPQKQPNGGASEDDAGSTRGLMRRRTNDTEGGR